MDNNIMEQQMAAAVVENAVPAVQMVQPEVPVKGMNGWVVAGTAVGGTLLGGLMMWGIPKLIKKFSKKKELPEAGSNEQDQAQQQNAEKKADEKKK